MAGLLAPALRGTKDVDKVALAVYTGGSGAGVIGHWTLLTFDLRNKQVGYYDSWNPTKTKAKVWIATLKRLIKDTLRPEHGRAKRITWAAEDDIPLTTIPQQFDLQEPKSSGLDCGIFVMMYAAAISRNTDLTHRPFTQGDMLTIRSRLALDLLCT